MEERPTELQQSALAAEPAGWAVCEWAAGLWRRGLSVDGQAGGPAPLAQSGRSTARTSRSEYVSGAARYRLLPRTARAPGARDPSSASVDCSPRTATTCAPCFPSHRASSHPAPRILLDRSVQIPAGTTCRHLPGAPGWATPRWQSRPSALRPLPDGISWTVREPSSSGAPSPAGAARLAPHRAPRAMAGARPPPGLLPLLAPLLLLLLLPAGCWALEGERRRGPARYRGAPQCGAAG